MRMFTQAAIDMIEADTGIKVDHTLTLWAQGVVLTIHFMADEGVELGYITDLSEQPTIFDDPRLWGEEMISKHERTEV